MSAQQGHFNPLIPKGVLAEAEVEHPRRLVAREIPLHTPGLSIPLRFGIQLDMWKFCYVGEQKEKS